MASSNTMGPLGRFFFARIFPLPFAIAGACILYFGLVEMKQAKLSVAWPTVTGVVVISEMEVRRDDDGTSYSAEIAYDYEVDGVTYSSNQVKYGAVSTSSPKGARKVLNAYPLNQEVSVHYMPENPEESVLEPGVHTSTWFTPAFGSVFLVVGLLMMVFLPRVIRSSHGPSHSGDANDDSSEPSFR